MSQYVHAVTHFAVPLYSYTIRAHANLYLNHQSVVETAVNTITVHAKAARLNAGSPAGTRKAWKKAIVKLTADSKTIGFFDSLM